MRLHSISYTEFQDQSYAWSFDEFSLININLIVGKNATGKSRLLRVLNGLARLIEGSFAPSILLSGRYVAVFKDRERTNETTSADIKYVLEISNNKVVSEVLFVGDAKRLDRGREGRGVLYFQKNKDFIDVQIPLNILAVAARRDEQQHDFFEGLHNWARSVRYFEFSKVESRTASAFDGAPSMEALNTDPLQNNLHLVVKLGRDRFNRDFISPVIADMRKIGYLITDFGLAPIQGVLSPIASLGVPQSLFVMENGVEKRLLQQELSDGMLRALATLIYIHFIRLQKDYGCILIDDIGEGLDFERATKLISVVIGHAESGHLQMAMTSNDRFVMNNVPLKYWSIVERNGGVVKVFNERNSKDRFDEFEEYGFSNFDFFAKGFFSQSIKQS